MMYRGSSLNGGSPPYQQNGDVQRVNEGSVQNGHLDGGPDGAPNGTMNSPAVLNGLNGSSDTDRGPTVNGANGVSSGASTALPQGKMKPVAICGMGLRLPGGIGDADAFWKMLYEKRSGRVEVPKDRYNVDNWYAPGRDGHTATKYGYYLDHINLGNADTSFWSMNKKELETVDPQQRLALEVVYECLSNAGEKPQELRGRRIGVFGGSFEGDWLELDQRDTQRFHEYRLTGYGDYMLANRVHYEFGFTGPRYVRPKRHKTHVCRCLIPCLASRSARLARRHLWDCIRPVWPS